MKPRGQNESVGKNEQPVVLVDTTELFGEPLLESAGWVELLARCRRSEIRLVVSEVSIRESERQVAARLENELLTTRRTVGRMGKLGAKVDIDFAPLEVAISEATARYSVTVRTKLEEAGGEVLPLPCVTISRILDRDLSKRRPFSPSGKGFRDTLIWESLLEELSGRDSRAPVYLVTGNSKDFTSAGGAPHPDLADDLDVRTDFHVANSVVTVNTVLAARFATFDEDRKNRLELSIGSRQPNRDLATLVAEGLHSGVDQLIGNDVDDHSGPYHQGLDFGEYLPRALFQITIADAAVDDDSMEFTVHEEYEGDTFSIGVSAEVEIQFDGWVDASDYFGGQTDFHLISGELGDHEVEVSYESAERLSFTLVITGESIEDVVFDHVG